MRFRPPQFAVDVFRDLRDRRLLIPAALLLAALVAVPMLLSRSSVPSAPLPAEPAALSADESATQPAVLAEGVSVRDYERRLEDLKSKNPFAEQFSAPATDGGGLQDPAGELPPIPDTGSGPGRPADPGGDVSPLGGQGASPPPSGGTPPDTSEPRSQPEVERHYFSWRIDVTAGPVGAAVERNGVKQLSLLPSNAKPVVVFLGIGESGHEAVFAVSSDAIVDDTEGRCEPSPANCAYLVLSRGEGASLDYAPDSTKYRLALRKIRRVEIDDPGKLAGKF